MEAQFGGGCSSNRGIVHFLQYLHSSLQFFTPENRWNEPFPAIFHTIQWIRGLWPRPV